MRLLSSVTAFALSAFATIASVDAQAAAIYHWVNIECPTCSGTIELSDEAYFAGEASYSGTVPFPGTSSNPGSSILQIRFGLDSSAYNWGPDWFIGRLQAQFLVDGDRLSGYISGSNDATTLDMSDMHGTPALWTLEQYASDTGNSCGGNQNLCAGRTGYWLLASAPARAVPEPATIVLVATGLLFLRYRRKTSGEPVRRF